MTEFDHPIPEMETIQDVLDYIRRGPRRWARGKWVVVRQVFITRLKEQRYPDARRSWTAPRRENPVLFATGPDASLNSLALKLSGIDKNFQLEGPGKVEKDPATGEPTGILRNLTRLRQGDLLRTRKPTVQDRGTATARAVPRLQRRSGITSIIDRDAERSGHRSLPPAARGRAPDGPDRDLAHVETSGHAWTRSSRRSQGGCPSAAPGSPMLRIDRHQDLPRRRHAHRQRLHAQALGREQDLRDRRPELPRRALHPSREAAADRQGTVEAGLQFTAHSVGDGAVHDLLDAYEEVNQLDAGRSDPPVHHPFQLHEPEAIEQAARLGVVVDIQPAWLYLDTRTLVAQFGYDRLRYFQPLHSLFEAGVIAGGGSDHMQKIGSLRSINPYNPFLAMWVAITRQAKGYEGRLHPEEALTREQAIRFYTINNATLLFLEDQVGSLEEGKLADFVVLDRDILTCPEDEIRAIRPLATYMSGKAVFERSRDALSLSPRPGRHTSRFRH